MTHTSKARFLTHPASPVLLYPHETDSLPLWTSTCRQHEMHINSLEIANSYNDLPGPKLIIDSNMIEIYLKLIYVAEKFHLLFRPKAKILVKKSPTSLHEKKTG